MKQVIIKQKNNHYFIYVYLNNYFIFGQCPTTNIPLPSLFVIPKKKNTEKINPRLQQQYYNYLIHIYK